MNIIDHIVNNAKLYFVGMIIVLIGLISQMKAPVFDATFEAMGLKVNDYLKDYKDIHTYFNENEKILIEIVPNEKATLFELKTDVLNIEDGLKLSFDTIQVRSFLGASSLFYSLKKSKKISALKALKKFEKIELFSDLVSKDKKSFLVILDVQLDKAEPILKKLDDVLTLEYKSIKNMNLTSRFHIEGAINEVLVKDMRLIISTILISFLIIMLLAYRSGFAVFYVTMLVILSVIVSFVVFLQFNISFNLITLMVMPVVIVLTVADGIHLLTGLNNLDEDKSIKDRIKIVYQKYLLPSFLTSITTAVAFFSLGFNDTMSIVYFGQITAISIIASFVICFLISPFIFMIGFKPKKLNSNLFNISLFFINRKKEFSYLFVPVIILVFVLIPKLQFKNDFEIYLPLHSKVKEEHDLLKSHFYSQASIEIAFKLKDTSNVKPQIINIANALTNIEEVVLVRHSEKSKKVMTRSMIPVDLAKISGYNKKFSSENGVLQRMQLKVKNPNKIPDLEFEVRQILDKSNVHDIKLTSQALIFSSLNAEVGASLIKSLLVSSLFLFFVFLFLTKSGVKALIGMFANLVPLSFIVIIFVLFDLNINIVTSMTAVVCLGLIVDDTIHAFYRRSVRNEALNELGFGMLTTTLLLMVGFGVFAMSSLKPIIIFGLVSSVVFIVTLISDFTILLYLLNKYDDYLNKKNKAHD